MKLNTEMHKGCICLSIYLLIPPWYWMLVLQFFWLIYHGKGQKRETLIVKSYHI